MLLKQCTGIIVFLAIYFTTVSSFPSDWFGKTQYRLPNNTKPISYKIHITTGVPLDTTNFTGTVTIAIKVINDTKQIVLHAYKLEIKKISLVDQESNLEVKDVEHVYSSENQFLTISSNTLLEKGNIYVLTIAYNGIHDKKSRGFFTSSYVDLDGNDVVLATTNFEPTYARNAFPCYDEPAFKAKFTITLTHNKLYTALSNMPQDGELIQEENGMVTTKFKESPRMSTYTVAFLITTHRHVSTKIGDVTQRVFYPPIAKSNPEITLQLVVNITELFEQYFDMKYPLPKLDHISIPGMTLTGMENWGLIVYQFGFLLPTSDNSYLYNITTISNIVHEISHQWIGNLITLKWWSYTWLNEGLATFYTKKIMQLIYPQFDTDETELFLDGVTLIEQGDSPPLTRYVETREEIKGIFNTYTYYKGAYILRMFEHALTENTFKKGVIQYMKDNQYSATEEDDLFNSLQAAATNDKIKYFEEPGQVAKMMQSWTTQHGFPFIRVIRDYENGTFKLVQSSLAKGTSGSLSGLLNIFLKQDHQSWWIPITYATASSANFEDTATDFILPKEQTFEFDPKEIGHSLDEKDWLILNKKRIGLYSVNYDEKNWELIIETLKTDLKKIHVFNRAQLIRDAWKFVSANALPKETLINLLSYLKDEDQPSPWHEAIIVLRAMFTDLQNKPSTEEETLKKFTRDIIGNIYTKIGTEHIPLEHPLWEKIRPKLFGLACDSELTECESLIEAKYKEAIEGKLEDTYMMKEYYCRYLKQATDSEVEDFMKKFMEKRIYPFDKRQTELLLVVSCKPSVSFAINLINYMHLNVEDILNFSD